MAIGHSWHAIVAIVLLLTSRVLGHGGLPINVFLGEGGQLRIDSPFEAGPLTQFNGEITTDLPGVAVLSPGNLVADGSVLEIDVLSGLAYWNGNGIAATDAKLEIRSPVIDGFGHPNDSPVEAYVVSEESKFQTGMQWGIYDGVVPGWDSHGMFSVSPLSSPTGVYGVLWQVTSPGLLPTEPFVVPFAYDPSGLGELSVEEYEAGVNVLTAWANEVPSPLQAGDANQDLSFDESDLIEVFQAGKYRKDEPASWSEGDWNGAPGGRVGLPPIGDGLFNESDLIAAFQGGIYRTGDYAGRPGTVVPVPECRGWIMIVVMMICCGGRCQAFRRSPCTSKLYAGSAKVESTTTCEAGGLWMPPKRKRNESSDSDKLWPAAILTLPLERSCNLTLPFKKREGEANCQGVPMNHHATLVLVSLSMAIASECLRADEVIRFEAELNSASVTRDGTVASESTAEGKAFLSLIQPTDGVTETSLDYDIQLESLDLSGLQTIGVTNDDVTAIHIHDPNYWPDGSRNDSLNTVGTLHVFNIFGVPRGGDDDDMSFNAGLATVSGSWDDSDASPTDVVAPTVALTPSISSLSNGDLFIMLHTTEFQNGAIGGHIRLVPEPSIVALLLMILLCGRRRTRVLATSNRTAALFCTTFVLSIAPQFLIAQDFGWSNRADLLEANSEMAVAELDGDIYVLGGYPSTRVSVRTVQVYDIDTNTWELTTPLPRPTNHPMAASVSGKLYFIGGQVSASGGGPFLGEVHEFDPLTELWTPQASMPTARGGGVAAVIDDKIYVAGGRPPHGNDFAVYDPANDEWTPLPDIPTDRNHTAAAAIDGKMYVVGGRFGAGFRSEMTNALEVYDPATNEWSSLAPMPTVRGGLNAVAANGCLHVFGGEGASGMFGEHEVYDPFTNTWDSLPDMPIPVHGVTGLAFHDGTIYLPGGGTRTGGSSGSTIHQVFRPEMSCQPTVSAGDFTGDGILDVADLQVLTSAITDGSQAQEFDLNGDQGLDVADRNYWITSIRETWFGDANLDGEFNSGDLVAVFQAGKFELDQDADWKEGDWDGDQRFGTGDLVAAFQDGGFEQGPRAAKLVPEPASPLILIMGMLASMRVAIRLNRSSQGASERTKTPR